MRRTLNCMAAGLALALGGAVAAQDAPARARVGDAAPAFSLKDVRDATHTLEQYRGKIVVLEWFNPDCPAVIAHHKRAKTMKEVAARYRDRDVVWLAINSGAPGKQGTGVERNVRAIEEYEIEYPVLLDPTGATGRAYGAMVTPTMAVIDREGKLAYRGAIDDKGQTNYVAQALDALLAGQPVATPETRGYG